jgi:zinc protease
MSVFLRTLLWVVSFCAVTPVSALKIQEGTTPQGLKFWLVQDTSIPVISLAFSFEGGTANAPENQEGILDFATEMLFEGTKDLDARALKEKIETLGIQIDFDSDKDYCYGILRTNLDNHIEAFKILKAILTSPRLAHHSIELVRERRITNLRNLQKQPTYLVKEKTRSILYKNHPYGRPQDGTLKSLKGITKKDLENFLSQEFRRQGLKIVLCGNIDVEQAMSLCDEVFGALPKPQVIKALPPVEVTFPGKDFIEKGPFPQSVCLFVQQGLMAHDPNFTKLALLSDIMGGKTTSRLFQEVRETRGLAYSVDTFLDNSRCSSLLVGYVASENARIKEAVTLIRKEWEILATKGVTEKELTRAKQARLGAFAFALADTKTTVLTLLKYQIQGFTPQYIYDRAARIKAVTLADINAFAKSFIKPDQLTFFIVGEPKGFE